LIEHRNVTDRRTVGQTPRSGGRTRKHCVAKTERVIFMRTGADKGAEWVENLVSGSGAVSWRRRKHSRARNGKPPSVAGSGVLRNRFER